MRVLITGANGFIGQMLVARLLRDGALCGRPISALLLLDKALSGFAQDERVRLHRGDIGEPPVIRRLLADGINVVFHLASVPGGMAEQNYPVGYNANLLGSLELLNQLRCMPVPPVIVYASSVAVYGGPFPARMDEATQPDPLMSFGAHKQMIEIAINDLARRGEVDGRVIRLPAIVARPHGPSGYRSAFMSDLLRAFANGEPYQCPVSPQAGAWWMSAHCCVENLLIAAGLEDLGKQRVWQLPVLRLSIAQVIDALAAAFGDNRRALIDFAPDPELESFFASFPAMKTRLAKSLGFRHDGSAAALIRNALNPPSPARIRAHGQKRE